MTGSNCAEAPWALWRLDGDAAVEARRLVGARFTASNRADPVAMRAIMHVPHVALPGPWLTVHESEPSLQTGARVAADDWHHSRLERLDLARCSADKVHCAVRFGKHAADGRRYADAEGVCVVTRRGGRWGIALSSTTMRPIGVGGGDHDEEVALATSLLRRWLAARDAADATAMRQLVHLPFVELLGQQLVVHRNAAALRRSATRMQPAPAWWRRELLRTAVRERSANKVTIEADVARMGADRTIVSCEAAFVIAAELQGRWAMQVYSAI